MKAFAMGIGITAMVLAWPLRAATEPALAAWWSISQDSQRSVNGHRIDLKPLIKWWTNVVRFEHLVALGSAAEGRDARASLENYDNGTRPLAEWFRIKGEHIEERGASWILEAQIYDSRKRSVQARIVLRHPPERLRAEFQELRARYERLLNVQAGSKEARMSWDEREHLRQDVVDELKVFPNWTRFALDCLALRTGEVAEGMSVYDCGL